MGVILKYNVMVIGDTHIPFEHRNYLNFCKRIKTAYKPKKVVHIGDLVDNHAISYHEHDPDGWNPAQEMQQADKKLEKWFKAFPDVLLCRGNHDRLIDRKGKTVGLPSRAFKSFRDIWNLPKGWKDDFQFDIGGVLYMHEGTSCGKYGHIQTAIDHRQSIVMGHLHAIAGVEHLANEKDCIFGMCVGCGIDRHAYAFEYGKKFKRKPVLGCGIVEYTNKGINPTFIPMDM